MTTDNSIAELSKTFRLNSSEIAYWQYIKDKKRREEARKMALEREFKHRSESPKQEKKKGETVNPLEKLKNKSQADNRKVSVEQKIGIEDQKLIVKEHNLLNDRITNFLTHLPDPSSSLFYLQRDKKYPEYKREHFVKKHHFSPQEFIFEEFVPINFVENPYSGEKYKPVKFKMKIKDWFFIILFELIMLIAWAGITIEIGAVIGLFVLLFMIIGPKIILIPTKRKHEKIVLNMVNEIESKISDHVKEEKERKRLLKLSEEKRLEEFQKKQEDARKIFDEEQRKLEDLAEQNNENERKIFEIDEDRKQAEFEYSIYAEKMHYTRLEKGCIADIKAQLENVLPFKIEKHLEFENFDYEIAYKVKNKKELELIIIVPDEEIIPDHLFKFIERGKRIKTIEKSKNQIKTDYVKFISSLTLWHGIALLFEIPSAEEIRIKSFENVLSEVTGNEVYGKIIELNIERSICEKINFIAVDPIKVLQNFEHDLAFDGRSNIQITDEIRSFDELSGDWIFAHEGGVDSVEIMKLIGDEFNEEEEIEVNVVSVAEKEKPEIKYKKDDLKQSRIGKIETDVTLQIDLNEDERKYSEVFYLAYKDKVITDEERDLLDIQADMFEIDPKRQIQIEKQLQKI